jgi:hypothetical protein
MRGNEIGGALLLPPEFSRQSSGLGRSGFGGVIAYFSRPQFCSNANSCMSNCAKLSGGRPSTLALLLPLGTLTVTLSLIALLPEFTDSLDSGGKTKQPCSVPHPQ